MFIVCPNCSTKYLVDPAAISVVGRDVRCAKCAHSWFQAPPDEMPDFSQFEQPNQRPRPIPEGSSLPVKVDEPYRTPLFLKIATIVSILLVVLASGVYFEGSIRTAVPALAPIYASFGVTETSGLVLADVEVKKTTIKQRPLKEQLIVRFKILNESKEPRAIPGVRVTLVSDKTPGSQFVIKKEAEAIKPGGTFLIQEKLFSDQKNMTHIKLELGNSLELMRR